MLTKPVKLKIVTEAPTPHNNYLFSAISALSGLTLDVHYLYTADNVPERPWKNLSAELPGARRVRTGLGSWFDAELLTGALFGSGTTHFVIGWNHPLLVAVLALLGLRRRPVLTWFDTPMQQEGGSYWKLLLKRLVVAMINRSPGTVFVTGRLAAEGMARQGIRREKMATLPFFVPFAEGDGVEGDVRQRFGIVPGSVIVLGAGRLVESKGFDLFIEAIVKAAPAIRVPWVVLLVGSGPEAEQLEQQAAEAGVTSLVRFVPWVEADDFARLMAAADVFVAPARFDPFPTTIISAMRNGKVVIASDGVGSALEFVRPGENGIMVPKGAIAELCAALTEVVNCPETRAALGSKAAETMAALSVETGAAIVVEAVRRAANEGD